MQWETLYLVYMVGEILPCLHIVNFVGVLQAAKGFEVGLFLQERDEVIGVAAETSRNDLSDLTLHIIWLRTNTEKERAGFKRLTTNISSNKKLPGFAMRKQQLCKRDQCM